MPFLLGCTGLFFPRLVLFLIWLFGGNYLFEAFEHWLWLLLGFIFLPLTTLAYVFSFNSLTPAGDIPPMGWVLVVLAIMCDVGLVGGRGLRGKKD